MREHLLGRTPRLTVYFCGIAIGLALLVAGLEATRIAFGSEFSATIYTIYAAIGLLGGFLLAFVASYLNGSILASWAAGTVPVAGRLGPVLVDGSLREIGVSTLGIVGSGVLLGAVGFAVAVEKHRRDARSADLPDPLSRTGVFGMLVISTVLGGLLLAVSAAI
jgi:hypothetical protein